MSSARFRAALAAAAALSVAIATRAVPLYWSPLPATLDGVRYATLARLTLARGLPLAHVESDELLFTGLLSVASSVTGVEPLYLAQATVAVAGAAAVPAAFAIARRFADGLGWSRRRALQAGVLAAFALAIEGLFVRRTGVPDEEALGLVLVPLLVLAAARALATRRPAWVATAVGLGVALPPLHNFSSAMAALATTALVAARFPRPSRRTATGVVAVAAFWAYFLGYFAVAAALGLELTYSGLLADHPGLFVAWVVLLLVGVAWFRSTSARARRLGTAGVMSLALLVPVNALVPVFPGTVRTPPLVLALVAPLAVPAALFVWGVPRLGRDAGAPTLALFVGPATMVGYLLTAALTPQFFGAVQRAQSFLHVAVFVLAAVVAVALCRRRPLLGRAAVAALVVAAALTLPLAYVHLDTGSVPSTVREPEFAGATFARSHAGGPYASDHRLTRMGSHARLTGYDGRLGPTRSWLAGGPPPECPTLAQRAWTTDGAHFYPAEAERIRPDAYRRWLADRQIVYDVGGPRGTTLSLPRTGGGAGC